MPLTLVLGPANSAKAGEVLGAYAAAAPRGALLVVPTAADAEHYSRELAEQGCVLRSVLTFTGLAERIALATGYRATRLTGLARRRVLRRAIGRTTGSAGGARLSGLAGVAATPGFVAAASQLIEELERSLITPQRFADALRKWRASDAARGAYAADVAAIYLGYARELERLGRVDGELFAWRALDALRLAPGSWSQRPVFFYGFDDLTPLERDAVETLARVVGAEVMVSLNFEPGKVATAARAELVAELEPLASQVIELPARREFYAPGSRGALHHVERTLFEPGAQERLDPGPVVRLLEAAGDLAEAELVASEVLRLLGSGVPAREIAVVYRAAGAAEPAIARTFARYGIPVAVSRATPFAHTALGRGLLALARCALTTGGSAAGGAPGGAADLLEYLRTPGALRALHVADRLELAVRCQGVTELAEARGLVDLTLGELDAVAESPQPLRELAAQGRRLLAAPGRASAAILDPEAALDARALARLAALPDELAGLGEPPRGRELLELLDELEVPGAPTPAAGAVLLSEPLAIRARRFRAVFVCGLQEGAFPWTAAPEPFLSDQLRRELAATSGLRLRPAEEALSRERYLFYACVSRATEQLILSYCSSDEDGNLRLPSPFLADVEAVLDDDWRDRRRRRMLSDVVWPVDEAPTPRERERAETAARPGASADADAPPRRLGAGALAAIRHTQLVSAGALESYAECPVKWLVERELEPRRLEPTPEPLVRGSHAHELLERILTGLGGPVTPESLPRALRLLEVNLAELPADLAPGRPEELRRALAGAIAADLRRYLEHEARCGGGWQPRHLELRFGFEEGEAGEPSLPALVLPGPAEPVAVRGVIDRVDVEPGGRRAVVRDYKSGAARPEHRGSSWAQGRQLQVALYMVAVRDLLGLDPVAGLYQPLGGRDLRARGLYQDGAPVGAQPVANDARDPESLAAELEDACARAVALAEELRAGRLEPSPATCSRDGCRYPGICRCG